MTVVSRGKEGESQETNGHRPTPTTFLSSFTMQAPTCVLRIAEGDAEGGEGPARYRSDCPRRRQRIYLGSLLRLAARNAMDMKKSGQVSQRGVVAAGGRGGEAVSRLSASMAAAKGSVIDTTGGERRGEKESKVGEGRGGEWGTATERNPRFARATQQIRVGGGCRHGMYSCANR